MFDEYIDINKAEIPYQFEVDLGGIYKFEVHYNQSADFFTVDLMKDGVVLVHGEKLILNKPLFRNYVHIDLPKVQVIPADRSGTAKRITFNNFNETVFLYVVRDAA